MHRFQFQNSWKTRHDSKTTKTTDTDRAHRTAEWNSKANNAVDFNFKPLTYWNVDLRVADIHEMSLYRTKVDTMPIDENIYTQIHTNTWTIIATTSRQCPSFDRHTRNRLVRAFLVSPSLFFSLSRSFSLYISFHSFPLYRTMLSFTLCRTFYSHRLVFVREWSIHNVRYVAIQLF